jgi:hypothetical protein
VIKTVIKSGLDAKKFMTKHLCSKKVKQYVDEKRDLFYE